MLSSLREKKYSIKALSFISAGFLFTGAINYLPIEEAKAAGSAGFVNACTAAGGTNGTNSAGQGMCSFPSRNYGYGINLPKGNYKFEVWGAAGGTALNSKRGGRGGYASGEIRNDVLDKNFTIISGTVGVSNNIGAFNPGGFGTPDRAYNGGGGGSGYSNNIANPNLNSRANYGGDGGMGYSTSTYTAGGSGGGGSSIFDSSGVVKVIAGAGGGSGGIADVAYGAGGDAGFPGTGYTYVGGAVGGGGGGHYSGGGGGQAYYHNGLNNIVGANGASLMPTTDSDPSKTLSQLQSLSKTQIGQSGGGYARITELSTPPSAIGTNSIINDSSDSNNFPNSLNWRNAPYEKVRYTFTITNPDPNYDLTGITGGPIPTLDPNISCDSTWTVSSSTAARNNGTTSLYVECTPNFNFFNNPSAKSDDALNLNATFTGYLNGVPQQITATAPGPHVDPIITDVSISETATMSTPDNGAPGAVGLGDKVKYTYTFMNSGTTSLSNVTFSSPLLDRHPEKVVNCSTIRKGIFGATCTVEFVASAADVANNPLLNTTTIKADTNYNGINVGNKTVGTTTQSSMNTEVTKISVTLPTLVTVTDVGPSGLSAGDTVRWTTVVTNNGNVSLTGIDVKDQAGRIYGSNISLSGGGGNTGTISTPNYVFTKEDAAKTPYTETVTATGRATTCSTSTCPTVSANASAESALTVYNSSNTSSATGSITNDQYTIGKVDLGDTYTVTSTIKNTGNTAWTNLSMKDEANVAYTCKDASNNTITSLGVGATATCSYSTSATKAILSGTSFTRTVAYTYTTAVGEVINNSLPVVTFASVTPNKAISLTISSNPSNANPIPGNTSVTFSYVVKNTGNINVTNPKVTTNDGVVVTCPSITLAPGGTATCSGTKVVN